MGEETLLSELCSICNTAKSKYRCPGCAARTCSLPCYKRHQQWADCNGKRDPTKYVKKSQLATPAGIDHDFNFLTRIERDLEKAERDVDERGLGAASDLQRKPRRGQLTGPQLTAIGGVTVIRAPIGLSRQKENKTHRTNKGHISWTVEWICDDKTRLLTQTRAVSSIAEAQPFNKSKKRKRGAAVALTSNVLDLQDAAATTVSGEAQSQDVQTGAEKPESSSLGQSNGEARTQADEHQHATSVEGPTSLCPALDGSDTEFVSSEYSFYLLRPRTSSNRHVLIPISASAPLSECLHGRTVLEFPTIYAFSNKTSMLQEEFMLEEDYLKQEGEEQNELDELMKDVDPDILRKLKQEGGDEQQREQEVDSNKILDVLKQDIGTGV